MAATVSSDGSSMDDSESQSQSAFSSDFQSSLSSALLGGANRNSKTHTALETFLFNFFYRPLYTSKSSSSGSTGDTPPQANDGMRVHPSATPLGDSAAAWPAGPATATPQEQQLGASSTLREGKRRSRFFVVCELLALVVGLLQLLALAWNPFNSWRGGAHYISRAMFVLLTFLPVGLTPTVDGSTVSGTSPSDAFMVVWVLSTAYFFLVLGALLMGWRDHQKGALAPPQSSLEDIANMTTTTKVTSGKGGVLKLGRGSARTGCCGHCFLAIGRGLSNLKQILVDVIRSPFHVRIMSLAVQVPMTQSLLHSIRCDAAGNVLGSANTPSPSSCSDPASLAFGVAGLLISLLTNAWLGLATLFTADPHRAEPISSLKTVLAGFSSGRLLFGLVFVRFLLSVLTILCHPVAVGAQSMNTAFGVLAAFLAFVLFFKMAMVLPFYHWRMNQMVLGFLCSTLPVALVGSLMVSREPTWSTYAAATAGTLWIVAFVLGWMSALWALRFLRNHFLRGLAKPMEDDSTLSLDFFVDAMDAELLSRYPHELLPSDRKHSSTHLSAVSNSVLRLGEELFPSSAMLSVFQLSHIFTNNENTRAALQRVKDVKKKFSLFLDVDFVVYSIGRSISEKEESFTLRRRIVVVKKKMRQIQSLLRHLWKNLLKDNVDLEIQPQLVASIATKESDCDQHFASMLQTFGDSPRVLRFYSEYLIEIKHDKTSSTYFSKLADRVELEQQASAVAASLEAAKATTMTSTVTAMHAGDTKTRTSAASAKALTEIDRLRRQILSGTRNRPAPDDQTGDDGSEDGSISAIFRPFAERGGEQGDVLASGGDADTFGREVPVPSNSLFLWEKEQRAEEDPEDGKGSDGVASLNAPSENLLNLNCAPHFVPPTAVMDPELAPSHGRGSHQGSVIGASYFDQGASPSEHASSHRGSVNRNRSWASRGGPVSTASASGHQSRNQSFAGGPPSEPNLQSDQDFLDRIPQVQSEFELEGTPLSGSISRYDLENFAPLVKDGNSPADEELLDIPPQLQHNARGFRSPPSLGNKRATSELPTFVPQPQPFDKQSGTSWGPDSQVDSNGDKKPRRVHTTSGIRKQSLAARNQHRPLLWIMVLLGIALSAFCITGFVLIEMFLNGQESSVQTWNTFGDCRNSLPLIGARFIRFAHLSHTNPDSPELEELREAILRRVTTLEETCLPFYNELSTTLSEEVYRDSSEYVFVSNDNGGYPRKSVRRSPLINILAGIASSAKAALGSDMSTHELVYSNADLLYVIRNSLNIGRTAIAPLAQSLIDLGVSDDVSKREVDIIAMSAMLGVAVLYYFALIMPMYWTHIKRQALSLRLFLAVPRAVVLRQYRQHRKSGAGATSLQALMEEGEDMKSFQQKRKSLRQNIPLTTFLLLFFAVVSFGLYFGSMFAVFETSTSLPREQNLSSSRQFLFYDMLGSVEIFNLVALHRQQVSSTTLDTSFAGSLVFAFDTLDLLNTELGSAWAEANRIEEQIRFARLDDVPMTGVDAPRLVDAQENLLFSLRCDETTSTSERSCQFYLSEVLEVQKNLRRFVARNMATQLATPTSQTPDEVGNVSLWVGQATTELNRDFPSASDTFTKSRAAFDTARNDVRSLSRGLEVSGLLIGLLGLIAVMFLLVIPAYQAFERKTFQLYKIFGYLPQDAVQQQEILFKFLYQGELVSENELNNTLTEGERKVHTVSEKSGDGLVMIDEKSIITTVNPRLCDMSGFSEDELTGAHLNVLIPPEARQRHAEHISRLMRVGKSKAMWSSLEVSMCKKSGEIIKVKISLSEGKVHGRTFFSAYVHSLEDEDRYQKSIQATEQKLAQILEGWRDGLVITDRQCNITSVNVAMETMFGYDKGDMVGMNVSSLCPDPHSQQHDAYVEHYLETGTSHVLDRGRNIYALKKDGTEFPAFLHVLDAKVGDEEFFVAFVQDHSEQRETLQRTLQAAGELKGLFDFVEDGIIVTDSRANIEQMNSTAANMLGVTDVDSLCSMRVNVREFIADPKERQQHDHHVERFKRDGVFTTKEEGVRGRVRRQDGLLVTLLIRVQEFRLKNNRYFAAFLSDEQIHVRERGDSEYNLKKEAFMLRGTYPSNVLRTITLAESYKDCLSMQHPFACVLALDVVNFTRFSSQSKPEELISIMSDLFDTFDCIAERHGVQRVKIIGDAYIAVAGLPRRSAPPSIETEESTPAVPISHNASISRLADISGQYAEGVGASGSPSSPSSPTTTDTPPRLQRRMSSFPNQLSTATMSTLQNRSFVTSTVVMGTEIIHCLGSFNSRYGLSFRVRVGIDCGSLVSACIGQARSFDIFGDTYTRAAELECSGKPDCIHVSEKVYSLVQDKFPHAERIAPSGDLSESSPPTYLIQGSAASVVTSRLPDPAQPSL